MAFRGRSTHGSVRCCYGLEVSPCLRRTLIRPLTRPPDRPTMPPSPQSPRFSANLTGRPSGRWAPAGDMTDSGGVCHCPCQGPLAPSTRPISPDPKGGKGGSDLDRNARSMPATQAMPPYDSRPRGHNDGNGVRQRRTVLLTCPVSRLLVPSVSISCPCNGRREDSCRRSGVS